MLLTYRTITPILIKLESLVEETFTGKSPAMLLYYENYEQNIFGAFIVYAQSIHLCKCKSLNHFISFHIDVPFKLFSAKSRAF